MGVVALESTPGSADELRANVVAQGAVFSTPKVLGMLDIPPGKFMHTKYSESAGKDYVTLVGGLIVRSKSGRVGESSLCAHLSLDEKRILCTISINKNHTFTKLVRTGILYPCRNSKLQRKAIVRREGRECGLLTKMSMNGLYRRW